MTGITPSPILPWKEERVRVRALNKSSNNCGMWAFVILAKAGVYGASKRADCLTRITWIPAFAGMTNEGAQFIFPPVRSI